MVGARVWPGIWLGSFMANIGTAFDATNAATLLTSAAIPTSIGAGAVVQALVGAFLVQRFVGFPNTLTEARKVGSLLVLGGPVGCMISATIGVTTLAIAGVIPWAMYSIHWGTWWVGDTFGVLITTPLVLTWFAEPRAVWPRRRISVALPLVGAVVLSVVVFVYARAQDRERLSLLFEHQAEALAHTIQTRLDDYLGVLHNLESFYASVPEISGQAFHTFIQKSLARHQGLWTLAWNLPMPGAQREAAKESAQQERSPSLQIPEQGAPGKLVQPVQPLEEISVAYIEPQVGDNPALGFDVVSIHDYREALRQARDTGMPAVTGRLTLEQEPDRRFGLLVFLPIYDPGLPRETVEERRQNLRGYVAGVFRIGDMVEASLRGLEWEGMALWIEDETAPAHERMLYDSRDQAAEGANLSPDRGLRNEPAGMHWKTTVVLAGRRWGLHIAPTPKYLAARQSLQPWTALGGGLAFTSLLGAFLLIFTGRAVTIEQLMVERTAQLEASKRLRAEAEQRRREAEVLAELARTINAALEVGTVLQRVADGAKELCRSDGAAIALREPGTEAAVIRYWAGMPSRGYYGARIELGQGIGGLVLATSRPYRTDHYARDPRLSQEYLSLIQAGRTVSVLVVPIRSGERVEGLLYVGSEQPSTFTDHDETILQRLADQAAVALHNAELYAAAERRQRTAESLAEVGRLLSQSLDSLEVGRRVVDHVQKLLQARVTALYQLEPTSGMLLVLAARDSLGPVTTPWGSIPPGMGAVGLAVHMRQPVVSADILADPRITLPAAVRASIELTSVRAVLALPLLRDGLVIGALSIGDESGRSFDEEDIELARFFADQVSSALANAQLYAEVHAAHERLQGLSRQLLEAHEAERHRIAHELHDQAGQLLVSVHLALEAAVTNLPTQFQECFCAVREHLDAIEAQLRRLAHELRPTILDDLGLLPALQFLTEGVAARTGLCIRVESTIEGRLAPHVETALYRIMQEGITNITRHAAATQVRLQLQRNAQVVHALLQDDGIGFDVDQIMHPEGPRGLGLLGIQERLGALGGTLQITSSPGQGTTLQIMVPIEPWEAASEVDRLAADVNAPASARLGGTGVGNAA
jgi:signal transduction histidine kinase/CHASE1-domain containing sensor protein